MTSVSQIIPNYFAGGISDQPDELKKPGQLRDCVNAFPDAVKGLYKRPGLEKVGELDTLCGEEYNISSNGSWFHFSRENVTNAKKQDYVGNVSYTGQVSVFRCSDGKSMPVYYSDTEVSPNDNESISVDDLLTCRRNGYLVNSENDALRFTTVRYSYLL